MTDTDPRTQAVRARHEVSVPDIKRRLTPISEGRCAKELIETRVDRAYLLGRCDELAAEVERLQARDRDTSARIQRNNKVQWDAAHSCYRYAYEQQAARIVELEGAIAETLRREQTMDGHTIGWLLEPLENDDE